MENGVQRVRPRSVLVVDDSTYFKIAERRETVHLLENTDALIVPYSGHAELNRSAAVAVHNLLAEAGQLVPKALFIRRPYDADGYELAENAMESFSVAKYHAFGNLARILDE